MSDTVKLQLQSVKGKVERVNPRGIMIAGTWYDFNSSFLGDKPGKEIVGQEVDLALADPKGGKQFFRAMEICGEIMGDPEGGEEPAQESAPQGASPVLDPATDNQVNLVKLLLPKAELTDEDLEQLCQIRFKKAFADLTKREASATITYLGGGDFRSRAGQRKQ